MSRIVTSLIAVLLLAEGANLASAGELTAGVARVDLTPPMSMKASLGGYGARKNKPAEGVHDRIYAKAMVLSDGQRRFALVTADVLAFPPGFKQAVVKALQESGWKSDQLMLLPSHSVPKRPSFTATTTALNPASTNCQRRSLPSIPQRGSKGFIPVPAHTLSTHSLCPFRHRSPKTPPWTPSPFKKAEALLNSLS